MCLPSNHSVNRMVSRSIKRLFDFLFALVICIFAFPVILVTMLVIKLASPEAPVLFRQRRMGFRCRPFTIYKLRTMTNERDAEGNLLPDEQRLKLWGKIIRKLSIDELSQIFNVFTGQMSWIGPRPLLPREMLVMTEDEQRERQSVPPGITGWEAVNEGKSETRRQMAEYDLQYARNWSLTFDMKIFFLTMAKLLIANRTDDAHRAPKLDEKEFRTTVIVGEDVGN